MNIGFAALLAAPMLASAHEADHANIPVLQCWRKDADIVCKSGWSLGWPMGGATLEVIAGGAVVATLKTDARGEARFAAPEGAFVVLLHDVRGGGQTVEARRADLASAPPGMDGDASKIGKP
jgi:hypothetical protein